jgi:hypothetical protein
MHQKLQDYAKLGRRTRQHVQSINGSFFTALRSSRLSPSHHPHTILPAISSPGSERYQSQLLYTCILVHFPCKLSAFSISHYTTSCRSLLSIDSACKHSLCRQPSSHKWNSILMTPRLHGTGEELVAHKNCTRKRFSPAWSNNRWHYLLNTNAISNYLIFKIITPV